MQIEIPSRTKKLLVFVMIVGCFFSTLNQTLLNVALPDLMRVFHVTPDTIQWLATGFMLVNGVAVPLTAFLMKRFTTRQLFISSMLFLFIGSLVSACAGNFGLLLTGRMIQAAGAGIILPLMMTVILYLYPQNERGTVMGKIGFAIIFAPAIAPTLAGFIIDYVSWRWLFIGMILISICVILLAYKYLFNVGETKKVKLDVFSVLLSTIGFGLVLFGFSSAGSRGWTDSVVLSCIIAGVIVIVIFCVKQLASNEPLLNLHVFKYKMFTLTSIVNILITILMYADLILLPMYLQNGRGFSALEAGLLLLPGALINAFLSPVAGKMYDKYGAKPMFFAGTIIVAISMFMICNLTAETSFVYIMIRTIILRIGLSCITMPLNTAALNALPLELGSHGSAVNNTVRQIAGAVGTAVVVTIYTMKTKDHLPSANAQIFGASDTYNVMFWIAVVAFVFIFLVPKEIKKRKA